MGGSLMRKPDGQHNARQRQCRVNRMAGLCALMDSHNGNPDWNNLDHSRLDLSNRNP